MLSLIDVDDTFGKRMRIRFDPSEDDLELVRMEDVQQSFEEEGHLSNNAFALLSKNIMMDDVQQSPKGGRI